MENTDGDDILASVFEKTNHPGADVRRIKDGGIIEEVQLKSTNQFELVRKHPDKYPDIPIAAIGEVASKMEEIGHSGFSDADLGKQVTSTLEELADDDPISHAEDVTATSGLISAAEQGGAVLQGKKSIDVSSGQALRDMGISVTSSFLVNLLFS